MDALMGYKREREAPELGAMMGRMLAALVLRAAEGDTEALEVLAHLEEQTRQATTDAIRVMQTGEQMPGDGYSYTELAAVLGITRQAVRQRVCR